MKLMRWVTHATLVLSLFVFTSCFNSNEVKIGVIIPSDGDLKDYGYQIRSGIEMAYKEVTEANANGKIIKNYQLIFENEDRNDINNVKAAFERLKKQGVTAIIGAASSSATLALTELANESRIILLSPASSSPEINEGPGNYVFRNYPSDTLQAQQLSNVIFQKCRAQKVLMVRARNAFSEGITFDLLRFGRQNSTQIPGEVVKFDSDPDKVDFPAVVDRIIEIDPQAVFLAAYNPSLVPLIREIRSREELSELYVFTCSSFLSDEAVKVLGQETVEGVMFTDYHWDPNENKPEIQEFSKKFQRDYHAVPTLYAATGYDAMWILVETMEGINHTIADEVQSKLNKNAYKGGGEGTEHYKLVLGETDFNKRGDVIRIPDVYKIANGVKSPLEQEEIDAIKSKLLRSFE